MRARYKPWAEDFLKEHANIVVLDPINHKGNWSALFANDQPIHVEIGAGKGQFITGMAKQHPDINFIAIEVVKSIIVSAVDKVVEEQSGNVKLINFDAKDLREIFADNEVSRIYLNFSDPWPKTKHAKRRLTYPSFLAQYQQVLKADGDVIFKTDNQGLFEYSLISFSEFGMVLDDLSLDLHQLKDPLNVMTEYEFKFSEKGQRIYRVAAHFSAESSAKTV